MNVRPWEFRRGMVLAGEAGLMLMPVGTLPPVTLYVKTSVPVPPVAVIAWW